MEKERKAEVRTKKQEFSQHRNTNEGPGGKEMKRGGRGGKTPEGKAERDGEARSKSKKKEDGN